MQLKPVMLSRSRGDLPDVIEHFWNTTNGRTLILYETDTNKSVIAALQQKRLFHSYRVVSERTFNCCARCLALANVERINVIFRPDAILYVNTNVHNLNNLKRALLSIDSQQLKTITCVELS
jgi:hypothetical protein